jgi:hypothetical protein
MEAVFDPVLKPRGIWTDNCSLSVDNSRTYATLVFRKGKKMSYINYLSILIGKSTALASDLGTEDGRTLKRLVHLLEVNSTR